MIRAREEETQSQSIARRGSQEQRTRENREGLDDTQRGRFMEEHLVRMQVTPAAEQPALNFSGIQVEQEWNQARRKAENEE